MKSLLQRCRSVIPPSTDFTKHGILLRSFVLWFLPTVFFVSTTFAQTFPSASSCTSKDLLLVSATLPPPNTDPCACGGTRTLMLGINNKTGSTRTSFAFWGTLEIRNSDGTLASSTSISGCNGPIPSNAITIVAFNQITFSCGQSLKLTNLFLAWTDASPNSKCPLNSATINPKCGTLPSIQIVAGTDADITVSDATCAGNNGSIVVSPFGGTAPYSVTIGGVTHSGIAAGGSTTFSNLAAANYSITISDSRPCSVAKNRTVGAPAAIPTPQASVTQPNCATAKGTVNVTSPDNTVTYTLKQGGVTKYTAVNGVFNNVDPGTYQFAASKSTCSTSGSDVTINAQPQTPGAPSVNITQPTCAIATGNIAITSSTSGLTFSLDGGSFASYPVGGYSVAANTNHTLVAKNSDGCSSGSTPANINAQPATPGAPSVNVTQPTCAVATGNIAITSSTSGLTFSLDGGSFAAYPAGGYTVAANSNHTLVAKNSDGCSSGSSPANINAQPATPGAPSVNITQPTCAVATGNIAITSSTSGLTFSLDGGSFLDYPAGGYTVAANTNHTLVAKNSDGCSSNSTPANVNAQPATPSFTVCLVQPTLCASTGSVTINASGGSGLLYSIDNGTTWSSGNVFNNLGSGSVSGIKVKNDAGCISDVANCDAPSSCQTAARSSIAPENISTSQTTVKAYPNPFSDKVKFVVTSPVSGKGNLEVYNMMGQRVKSIYNGFISAGTQTFELSLPTHQIANLVYVLRIGDKKISGKLLQINQ